MKIVTNGKLLRQPTEFVKEGEDITELVRLLFETLLEPGMIVLGLSANQIGGKKRVFVMKVKGVNHDNPVCIVNPVIHKERGHQLGIETCLSIPGVRCMVKRPQYVVVKGLNQYFKHVRYKLSGEPARIAYHELDHLCGKLITDVGEVVKK